METIKATLWIYRIAFTRSGQLLRENWAVVFAPLAYSVFLSVAAIFLIPLGLVGGLLLLLATNACMSSGLHLLENILNSRRADVNNFLKGFTVYLRRRRARPSSSRSMVWRSRRPESLGSAAWRSPWRLPRTLSADPARLRLRLAAPSRPGRPAAAR